MLPPSAAFDDVLVTTTAGCDLGSQLILGRRMPKPRPTSIAFEHVCFEPRHRIRLKTEAIPEDEAPAGRFGSVPTPMLAELFADSLGGGDNGSAMFALDRLEAGIDAVAQVFSAEGSIGIGQESVSDDALDIL